MIFNDNEKVSGSGFYWVSVHMGIIYNETEVQADKYYLGHV